ncbi:hypothetical protein ABZ820_16415 [Streptomyces diacarni]|uniref:hypothetical protein n=1 Tax=Streptomyces diacarni TaxID=2800381 RepID=UPI0033C3F3A0
MSNNTYLELGPDVRVTPSGSPLSQTPRYSLPDGYLTVSPFYDLPSHETLLSETTGSVDWLWSGDDELRFETTARQLIGCGLTVPEKPTPHGWSPGEWFEAPRTSTGIRRLSPNNFDCPPMAERWVSDTGDALVCVPEDPPTPKKSLHRLNVGPDLDFVFVDGMYTGWLFRNPAHYLVHAWEQPPSHPVAEGSSLALRDYLLLFTESNVERMQDEDVHVLGELDALRTRIAALSADPRNEVMRNHVTRLREDWYSSS